MSKASILTLQSIAAQTWRGDMRIVIADDGSAPEAVSGARALAETFGHPVTFIENRRNRGRPYTRNVLLDAMDSPLRRLARRRRRVVSGEARHPVRGAGRRPRRQRRTISSGCHATITGSGQDNSRLQEEAADDRTGPAQGAAHRHGSPRLSLDASLPAPRPTRNVGWFDERLPRLQDLDFFLRFALKGGRSSSRAMPRRFASTTRPISAGAPTRSANATPTSSTSTGCSITATAAIQPYAALHMEMHSARFAANNFDHSLANEYMWKAARARPRLFIRHLRRKGFRPGNRGG